MSAGTASLGRTVHSHPVSSADDYQEKHVLCRHRAVPDVSAHGFEGLDLVGRPPTSFEWVTSNVPPCADRQPTLVRSPEAWRPQTKCSLLDDFS